MITLNKFQVSELHAKLIGATGGSSGLRDESLLDTALQSAFLTFDSRELYPTVVGKIAQIAFSLVANHPFVDGNKRIGTYVMLILLELNDLSADFSDEEVVQIGLGLATGKLNSFALREIIEKRAC